MTTRRRLPLLVLLLALSLRPGARAGTGPGDLRRLAEGLRPALSTRLAGRPVRLVGVAAAGVAGLFALNLGVVSLGQPELPLGEQARIAGEMLKEPELHVMLTAFVAGDAAARRALKLSGMAVGDLTRLVVGPGVGEVVAEVALGLLETTRLEHRARRLELRELRRFAGSDRGKSERLQRAHETFLAEALPEALVRDLTGGSIDYTLALASGGGWAVGALAGGVLAGPFGGLAAGIGGAVAARKGVERIRSLGLDERELEEQARRLARGGLLDPRDQAPCGSSGGPGGSRACAAWYRGRRAARHNLLAWGAEGITRAADAWFEGMESTGPQARAGASRRLELGLAQARAAVRVARETREQDLHAASPEGLRAAGHPAGLRLVVAASRRVEARLIRELEEMVQEADLALRGPEHMVAPATLPVEPGAGADADAGAIPGGLFGL